MIRNVNDVVDWLRLNDLKSWEVRTKDTDNAIVFQTTESVTDENNFDNFKRNMELSKGGRYIIYASGAANLKEAKKGRFREEFENIETISAGSVGAVPSFMGIPDGFVRKEDVQMMIDKERMRNEMDRQKSEIEDLKEENRKLNEPLKKFIANISPLIAPVVSGIMQKYVPAAQIGTLGGSFQNVIDENNANADSEMNDEDDQRLRKALSDWGSSDSDFLVLIEKIAEMAKSGNPFYAQAKQMLLNM